MDPATLAALQSFPQLLEAHYNAIPDDHKHWAPASWEGAPSEAFTAIEQVCHVRDIEIEGYQVRIGRTLAQDGPLLPSINSEALALERRYGNADAQLALAAFRAARADDGVDRRHHAGAIPAHRRV